MVRTPAKVTGAAAERQSTDLLSHRANAYRLLSACFCEPDAGLLLGESVFEGLAESLDVISAEAAAEARGLRDTFHEVDPDEPIVEYARLFIGPNRLSAPPYGSVYLEAEGGVMGESTLAVAHAYRCAGLHADTEAKEPPDHVAIELEFLHFLSARESAAIASGNGDAAAECREAHDAFVDRFFAPWIPAFATRVLENTSHPYFAGLARCLRGFSAGVVAGMEGRDG